MIEQMAIRIKCISQLFSSYELIGLNDLRRQFSIDQFVVEMIHDVIIHLNAFLTWRYRRKDGLIVQKHRIFHLA